MTIPAVVIVAIVAGIIIAVRQPKKPSFDDENLELDSIVANQVEDDIQVKNCVLAVMKGDGSFAWSGAAGIANQDDPMRNAVRADHLGFQSRPQVGTTLGVVVRASEAARVAAREQRDREKEDESNCAAHRSACGERAESPETLVRPVSDSHRSLRVIHSELHPDDHGA